MRIAVVLVALLLGGCAGAYHTSSDGRLQTRIDDSYKARDACLAKNANADGTMSLDAGSVAQAAALACTAETDKLIEVSNRDGDPAVANRIRQDSEFRAMGYVLKARGQGST
ncbi:MAG: hypothetical protein K2X72_33215 [Reyranella sp.]|nr:hypothetical protein [Reyranella sp.]